MSIILVAEPSVSLPRRPAFFSAHQLAASEAARDRVRQRGCLNGRATKVWTATGCS